MEEFKTPIAIVISACITGAVTILTTLINKYGLDFWRPKRNISFNGYLSVLSGDLTVKP